MTFRNRIALASKVIGVVGILLLVWQATVRVAMADVASIENAVEVSQQTGRPIFAVAGNKT